ncbi:21204_t:CDS:2, partial [Entrophospora sp. SA101]
KDVIDKIVLENVEKNILGKKQKTDFDILVSGGAPGIGKTRFGQELFFQLKDNWTPPTLSTKNIQPHFQYICLDFGNGCPLDNTDYGLSSSIMPYIKYFNIGAVFQSIAEHLELKENQELFVFLHIDEFQLIDKWEKKYMSTFNKDFFKDMFNELATFMMNRLEAFVQTFISGTAPQVVISAKEPSRVSFHFVECPLLSMTSMIKIVDQFAESCNAEKFECGEYKWKLCRPFLYHLEDTGGLPHALQYLLEICFKELNNNMYDFFTSFDNQYEFSPRASKTLGIVVKLKELSVIQAHGQFPCENLVDKNHKHIDWMKGNHLIINGTSAKFADSFVVRDILGCNKHLLEAFQNKLSINAQQCTIKDFHKEINKNLESLYNSDGLFADYHIVTILFTTQPFDGDVADLDEDFLLISKENFAAYFGPVFSTRAMLSITNDINPNFSGWDMIKNNIPGAGDLTTTNIVSKRPYKSEEDLFNKHPRIKNAMDQFPSAKRPKLSFYPFNLE